MPATQAQPRRPKTLPKVTRHQQVKESLSVEFFHSAVILALQTKYPQLAIPSNAKIQVQIPGGGDWSNTNLTIEEHHTPITVSWTCEGEKTETLTL